MAVGCAFQRNRRSDSRLDPHDEVSNRAWNEYVASGPRHRARRIKALRPLLLDTTWRPKDMGIYGDMWSVHANARGTNYLRQEERARKFIKTLAQCTASQTHKALQALLDYDAHHVDDKCVAGWDLSWAMLTGTSLRAARKSTDACILWIQIVWYGVHAIAFDLEEKMMGYLNGFLCKDAFETCAQKVFLRQSSEDRFDVYRARDVLARAPLHDDIFSTYGKLLGTHLLHARNENDSFYLNVDVYLFKEYLQATVFRKDVLLLEQEPNPTTPCDFAELSFIAMEQYGSNDASRQGLEFIRVFMRTALQAEAREAHKLFQECSMPDGLDDVIGHLDHPGGHPVLRRIAIEHPTWIDRILDYVNYHITKQKDETYYLTVPLHRFYRALAPLFEQQLWAPKTEKNYWQLWSAQRSLTNTPAALWCSQFTRQAVQPYGRWLHVSLVHLLYADGASTLALDGFFPLPFTDCDAEKVWPLLVQLSTRIQSLDEGTIDFGEHLQAHHPKAASLIALHRGMYPNAKEAYLCASVLLESFKRSFDKSCDELVLSQPIDNIDANMFE